MRSALACGLVTAAVVVGSAYAATLGVTSRQLTESSRAVVVQTCTLSAATADSYTREDAGSSNFGTATTLDVRNLLAARRFSFVRFDLSSCAIPSGAWVESATLTLTVLAAPLTSLTYEVHRVTAGWGQGTITWSNQPVVSPSPSATFTTGTTAPATRQVAVTADVDAFVAGTATNNGWRIRDPNTLSTGATLVQFASTENGTAANRPRLEIRYAR
ncbi:MAG: DNRLRE domain-containing protein [Thermoleophilia bacterium]|nr:DNRLRE domain-containing protein [Thermoleophilia bacterium]